MKSRLIAALVLAMVATMLTSCHVDRYIGEDDHVLRANNFRIEYDSTFTAKERKDIADALSGVRSYATQTSNSRFLGVRAKLFVYCLANPDKDRFPHKWFRKIGEEPVVIDQNASLRTSNQIVRLLESKGCFHSKVDYCIEEKRHKDALNVFTITPTKRFEIEEVSWWAKTDEINDLIEKSEIKSESLIQVGECYDQNKLASERERIASFLQDEGYYLASSDLVTYEVDTTAGNGKCSISINISNPKVNRQDRPLQKYRIGDIYIYPNSNASARDKKFDTIDFEYKMSTRTALYKFVTDTTMALSPLAISRSMIMCNGWTWRNRITKNTYNALLNLKNFKYIKIEYEESPRSTDEQRLVDAHVRLQNNTRHKLSASLELSNMSPFGQDEEDNAAQSFLRNGNFGLETVLEYQNRNLFGGAEILKTSGSLLVELPKLAFLNENANTFHDIFSSFESGIDITLDVPKFMLPFTKNIVWQRARPHTEFSLGADYQYRSYFERFLTDASFGYSWRRNDRQKHITHQHQLIPVEVAFVRFFNLDEQFMQRLEGASDLRLKYQYSDHFVMDARYTYTYSTQQLNKKQNFTFMTASIETAGNLLNGLSMAFDGPVDENGMRQIFGVPYAQYAKLTLDAKRYLYLGKKGTNTFVSRLLAGVGLPYFNSMSLPYEKSFFGGGPSTMRAWQLRRLGPGSYQNSNAVLERIGDVSLVLNLEDRFHIFGPFEGAVFVDAGNVWLTNPSQDYPDGEWKWNKFYKDIAVGTGIGLRLNVSVLTLRCDFAIPLIDPGYASNEKWRMPHWKFNQVVTNLGIDYPF